MTRDGVSVVTVDDHPAFRSAAREVIETTSGFEPAGEAASGEEALAVVDQLRPQLVLVDVRMPGIDGIETARRLRASHPDVVVVLISMEEAPRMALAAKECGAVAFVRKEHFGPSMLRRLWRAYGPAS